MTLLLRVIALVIIGLGAAAAIEMMDADRPVPYQAGSVARAAALAQRRMATVTLADADSLARGTFPAPDTIYHWSTTARSVKGVPGEYDVTVTVTGHGAAYKLESRGVR